MPAKNPLRVLLPLLCLIGASQAESASPGPLHPRALGCAACHVDGETGRLVATQEQLCARCHQQALQLSHPSGFVPRHDPPKAFPLDADGRLTCSTCHDVHAPSPERLRRRAEGEGLCLGCHRPDFFQEMKDRGRSLEATGHLPAASTPSPFAPDRASANCMGCHEDHADRAATGHGGGPANHPIGMDYREARRRQGVYKPVSRLPRHVLLPGGKVSCVSCHRGYSRRHGTLAVANKGSELCLSCHDL